MAMSASPIVKKLRADLGTLDPGYGPTINSKSERG